jgi:hypothetical protein
MNDLARQTLSRIIAKHGTGICETPKRVEAILRDLCGDQRREINIIMGALEERVAADLTAGGNSLPRDVLFARLEARLRDNLAYTPEAARWGVETWAVALGVLSEAELLERTRKEAAASQSKAPPPLRDSELPGANPANVNPRAPRSQPASTHAPPRQPPQSSVQAPTPASPGRQRLPTGMTLPEPPEHDISPSPPLRQTSRRGLNLRSCLILFVLAIILIIAAVFVVPAIIMILRDEQARPSINEPRAR